MTVLVGNNRLHLNLATVKEALLYWLEGRVLGDDLSLTDEHTVIIELGINEVIVHIGDKAS